MLDPFDRSKCSFPVPEFESEEQEDDWVASLTVEQGFEIMHLMRVARWGEEVVNRPMDRTPFQMMTMEEFNRMKEEEDRKEAEWRRNNGWPPLPWHKDEP
jgi:hypothetical protein